MSYDLQIYAQRALEPSEIAALLELAQLSTEPTSADAPLWTVVRGARRAYCFTLGLPAPLEAEDVPEEIAARILGAAYIYDIGVEGSSPVEIPHAIRFARRLAKAAGGAVFDPQTDELWSQGKLRTADRVERGVVDFVELNWWVTPDAQGARAAEAWLRLARKHLPEAAPRRFGIYEPLSMSIERDGADAFVEAARGEGPVWFKASPPFVNGSVATGVSPWGDALPWLNDQRISCHTLSLPREALADARWRDALSAFFVALASELGAVFASAEVIRGVEWSGRSAGFGPETEHAAYLSTTSGWYGLPPYPMWWAWFGPDYAPLVREHLPQDRLLAMGGSLLFTAAPEPLNRDEIAATLAVPDAEGSFLTRLANRWGPARRRTSPPWLPVGLFPIEDVPEPGCVKPYLASAPIIPEGLRQWAAPAD